MGVHLWFPLMDSNLLLNEDWYEDERLLSLCHMILMRIYLYRYDIDSKNRYEGGFTMNYEDWGMTPAQDFMVPVEYHDRYGYLYPSLEPTIEHGMMHPIMYPDIYYRIYPYAHRTCERMDNPYMHYPSEAQVESMVTDCYDACINAMPDLDYYADLKTQEAGNPKAKSQDTGTVQFRRRPLLRDLIAIILISELFRRRRRDPYDYNNGYGPGAGYGNGAGAGYGNGVYGPGAGYSIGAGYGYEAGAGYEPGAGYGPGAGYNPRSGCSPCGGNYEGSGYDAVKKLFPF